MTTTRSTPRARHRRPHGRERAKGIVTVASALVFGLVASGATWSAFNAQTSNAANSFNTGTVAITDNDVDSAMFTVSGMRPGTAVSKCIKVTYTGTLTAGVKFYGATTAGTGLESYLQLSVTRGTSSGAFSDCTAFTADSTNHSGLGAGVLYSGLLSGFPATQGAGVTDPTAAWATNESHWYKFTVDVTDTNDAQNKSATETFTWDAR
ncbi:MAG TPA: TasA family protein [Actinoplanes sp.]|nr:TasA family protein [Actinoplanes sp.]